MDIKQESITQKTLTRHELIGLDVEVLEAKNKANEGVCGKIVNETQKSVVLKPRQAEGREYKRIFKKDTVFRVRLPDGKEAELRGDEIVGRPWERVGK